MDKQYREVLIFVTGMTPQVITETIYGLVQKGIIPDELYILTTKAGKEKIETELIRSGRFRSFCREFNIPDPILNESSFICLTDKEGRPLDDIRTTQDNETAGHKIIYFVRDKASDPAVRLHCSIAGGRKTMSFYLGSALQLFGRPWDRLYHVLVSPEFESNPDFYYKPRVDHHVHVRDRNGKIIKTLNTKDAIIELAELPFIRLRDKVPSREDDLIQLFQLSQENIDTAILQPRIHVSFKDRKIHIGDQSLYLPPMLFVLYTFFLKRKLNNCVFPDKPNCQNCTDCFVSISDFRSEETGRILLEDYKKLYDSMSGYVERFEEEINNRLSIEKIRSDISKIKTRIKQLFEDARTRSIYTVISHKIYGDTRYGIPVDRKRISIE